jgi:hypothetical protein
MLRPRCECLIFRVRAESRQLGALYVLKVMNMFWWTQTEKIALLDLKTVTIGQRAAHL